MTKDELKINQWYRYEDDYYVFCVEVKSDVIIINKYISPSKSLRNQITEIRISRLSILSQEDKTIISRVLKSLIKTDTMRELIEFKNPQIIPVYDLFIKTLLNE